MYSNVNEAYLKEFNKSIEYTQLEATTLTMLLLNQEEFNIDEDFQKEVHSCTASKILLKRLELIDKGITSSALAMLNLWADRPGVVVLQIIDLLNSIGDKKTIELDDVVNCYPHGFYDLKNSDQMNKIFDLLKDRKVKNSEIY